MEFDNFETDITTAEKSLSENRNERSEEKSTAEQKEAGTDGNAESENSHKGNTHELGLFEGISNSDYHLSPGISSTPLKDADKALILYYERMQGRVPWEETEAMRLGTATHALTLEALDFGKQIAVSKKFGRKKDDQEEKAEFYAENKGMTIIDTDQYEHCRRMRDSLMNLPEIADIFETGKPELSGYYIDKGEYNNGTGMLCRYRPDWRANWCIADVKTTKDIAKEAFSRTIHSLGYHISAAHYLEGDRITCGTDHRKFVFLCVEPKPPYLAAMYTLDQDALDVGIWRRRLALDAIKKARQTDEWPLYNHGMTQDIGIPSYAMYDYKKAQI